MRDRVNLAAGLVLALGLCLKCASAQTLAGSPGSSAHNETVPIPKDGNVDASTAIQARLGRGVVLLGCGTYLLDKGLIVESNGSGLIGESSGCVHLDVNFSVGDVLSVGKSVSSAVIRDLSFSVSARHMSGALIHLYGASTTSMEAIHADDINGDMFSDILVIDHSILTHLRNFYFGSAANDCIRVDGASVDTFISEGNTSGCGTGLHIRSASGVYLSRLDLVGSQKSGISVDPSLAQSENVNAVYGDTILSDSSQSDGVVFSGDGQITEVNLVDLWSSASGTVNVFTKQQRIAEPSSGIVFNNQNIDGISLSGARAKGNGGHGFDLVRGKNIYIGAGTQSLMNGAASGQVTVGATYDGFHISRDIENLVMVGVIAGPGGWEEKTSGKANLQAFGLWRDRGTTGRHIIVSESIFSGNKQGGYMLHVSKSDKVVDIGNIGN